MAEVTIQMSAKQRQFLSAVLEDDKITSVAYIGSRFNGKTTASCLAHILGCIKYPNTHSLALRRTQGAADMNLVTECDKVLYNKDWLALPKNSIPYGKTIRTYHFPNGSDFKLAFCKRQEDYTIYHGSQWARLSLEEGQQHSGDVWNDLSGSVRDPTCKATAWTTANPGSQHAWIVDRFIDPVTRDPDALMIHCAIKDAPQRFVVDCGYVRRRLEPLSPHRRKQYIDGDFSSLQSSFFDSEDVDKAIKTELPPYWSDSWGGVDWGHAAPFCCLWVFKWQEANGKYHCQVASELYRAGLHLKDQAEMVLEREEELRSKGILNSECIYYGDPMISKAVESETAEQSRTIRQVWSKYKFFVMPAHSRNRIAGWELIKFLLNQNILTISPDCHALLRELRTAQYEGAPGPPISEDLDKKTARGSHCLDSLRYCVASIFGNDFPAQMKIPFTPFEFDPRKKRR